MDSENIPLSHKRGKAASCMCHASILQARYENLDMFSISSTISSMSYSGYLPGIHLCHRLSIYVFKVSHVITSVNVQEVDPGRRCISTDKPTQIV